VIKCLNTHIISTISIYCQPWLWKMKIVNVFLVLISYSYEFVLNSELLSIPKVNNENKYWENGSISNCINRCLQEFLFLEFVLILIILFCNLNILMLWHNCMKIGTVDHPQWLMRHKRPQGSNSVTSPAQFNREFINMILPRQGAVNSDTQQASDSIINNISIFI
jgi:hypothetical protein